MFGALNYFSKLKNFKILFCLFLVYLLTYFDYYVFIFLVEKFRDYQIQHLNFLTIASSLFGLLIFMAFLTNSRRRVLNFTISVGLVVVSLLMLVVSLTLPKNQVDFLGIVSICKGLFESNL